VSARAAEEPSRPRDELAELLRLIGRLRWRLGWERLLGAACRCLAVAVALLSAVLLVDWLLAGHLASPGLLAAIPLAVAFAAALAWAHWPSAAETARVADRRLHLADRLATAVELAPALQAGADRRLDRLQLVDAVARAGTASGWPSLAATVRRDLAAALAATVFGGAVVLAVVLVPEAPRLAMSPGAGTGEAPAAPDTRPAETPAPPPAAAPPAPPPPPAAEPQRQEVAPSDPSLAQRARQEEAQRAALDRLAQQLRQLSATASAADAISRGDYAAARNGLADLGDNADQLSDAAKRQLAQALQAAASGSTGDPQLAQREQGAARALGQPDYAAQQKALRQLGDQLAQSGSNSPSSAQVQRDVGQLQAQRDAASGATGQAPSGDSSGQSPAGGLASGDQANRAGAGAGGGQGAPGGPGAGTGTTATMLGDPAPPLDAVGEHVEVPVLLSGSTSARPAQGDAQQADAPLGGSGAGSVAEAPRDGSTGHVAPEQNRVPGDQRGVVRGYFNGDAAR